MRRIIIPPTPEENIYAAILKQVRRLTTSRSKRGPPGPPRPPHVGGVKTYILTDGSVMEVAED